MYKIQNLLPINFEMSGLIKLIDLQCETLQFLCGIERKCMKTCNCNKENRKDVIFNCYTAQRT